MDYHTGQRLFSEDFRALPIESAWRFVSGEILDDRAEKAVQYLAPSWVSTSRRRQRHIRADLAEAIGVGRFRATVTALTDQGLTVRVEDHTKRYLEIVVHTEDPSV